jgi:hypothetical protein
VTTDRGEVVYERADDLAADQAAGTVYRRRPGGEPVVATGRAFVRFPEGESAEAHREALAAAGFELEEVPSYAPNAAWVRAGDGSVAAALHGIDALARLPGVERVEPQLVGEAARRGEGTVRKRA